MPKCLVSAWYVLMLGLAAPGFANDFHAVFTASSSWYGQEKTSKAELWIGTDRECHLTPQGTRIVRRDLGLVWQMQPNGKAFSERPLRTESAYDPGTKEPQRGEKQVTQPDNHLDDLRFTGLLDAELQFDWNIRPLGNDVIRGQPCQAYSIKGDADFAEVNAKMRVSPAGSRKGLAAPRALLSSILTRDEGVIDAIEKILAEFPDGGLVSLEMSFNPPIGPVRKAKITLDVYEVKEPPARIYEIPEGIQKDKGDVK